VVGAAHTPRYLWGDAHPCTGRSFGVGSRAGLTAQTTLTRFHLTNIILKWGWLRVLARVAVRWWLSRGKGKWHVPRKYQGVRLAALVSVTVLIIAGCGSSSKKGAAPSSSATTTPGAVKAGGTLTELIDYGVTDFDPAAGGGTGASQNMLYAVYGQLLDLNSSGQLVPDLALSVTSTDGVHWTIDLRPGVTFSDGTPFNAQAVMYNFTRDANPTIGTGTPSPGPLAKQITSMTVVNATTLQVTLDAPDASFPDWLQGPLGMIASPTAIQKEGAGFATQPVGAGPFLLTSTTPTQDNLTRNPNYWDKPKPYLDSLVFKIVSDSQQQYNGFTTGSADALQYTTGNSELKELESAGYPNASGAYFGGNAILFNTRLAPFNDQSVRQAFGFATNLEAANQAAADGSAVTVTNLFLTDSPYYEPNQTQPTDDPTKAQQLISAYVSSHGPIKATLTCPTVVSTWCEAVQQQWNTLKDVNISLNLTTSNATVADYATHNFQLILGGIEGATVDPNIYNYLYSTSAANFTGLDDPALDAAETQARDSLTVAGRKAAYNTIQTILWQQMPAVFLYRVPYTTVVQNNVKGLSVDTSGYAAFQNIWLS
jgi:peptide/nickel transport system substrate-binding protein